MLIKFKKKKQAVSFLLILFVTLNFYFFYFESNECAYRIEHFRFFFLSLPTGGLLFSANFLALISLIKSKNALSTLSLVLADVSMYGLAHLVALSIASSFRTCRFCCKSDLFPISINGTSSAFFTLRICSLKSDIIRQSFFASKLKFTTIKNPT